MADMTNVPGYHKDAKHHTHWIKRPNYKKKKKPRLLEIGFIANNPPRRTGYVKRTMWISQSQCDKSFTHPFTFTPLSNPLKHTPTLIHLFTSPFLSTLVNHPFHSLPCLKALIGVCEDCMRSLTFLVERTTGFPICFRPSVPLKKKKIPNSFENNL